MKKSIIKITLLSTTLFVAASCSKDEAVGPQSSYNQGQVTQQINNLPKETLSAAEKTSL